MMVSAEETAREHGSWHPAISRVPVCIWKYSAGESAELYHDETTYAALPLAVLRL